MASGIELDLIGIKWDSTMYTEGDAQQKKWKEFLFQPRVISDLESFVSERVGDLGRATYMEQMEGNNNIILKFRFDAGRKVVLRMPKPGHSPDDLMGEKITAEATWMQYLAANTTIPIPHIYCFSSQDSTDLPVLKLPYILMDAVMGQNLREYLTEHLPRYRARDQIRAKIYEQIADFYLQLHRLKLNEVGTAPQVTGPSSGQANLSQRLFTRDMHRLIVGVHHYPVGDWPTGPFQDPGDYFRFLANQQRNYLFKLRSLNIPRKFNADTLDLEDREDPNGQLDIEEVRHVARLRFKARHGFMKLIDQMQHLPGYNQGPFLPFITDFDPRNMVFDSRTNRITGVFDFEFTNAMPAPFLQDPPLWLTLDPAWISIDGNQFESWVRNYNAALPQFLDVMKRVEQQIGPLQNGEPPLSDLMLESWTSKRFWFNYAAENIENVDQLYYAVLHKLHQEGGEFRLSPDLEVEMENYAEDAALQIGKYKKAQLEGVWHIMRDGGSIS